MNDFSSKRASVIMPAYNEAERIAETVHALRKGWNDSLPSLRVVVVDDHSEDDTAKRAEQAGADTVLRLNERTGKGGALWQGKQCAPADFFLFIDADLGETAVHAPLLLEPLLNEEADLSIAKLPHEKKGGGSGRVVRLAREGIKQATGLTMDAPLSGQRALTRACLDALPPFDEGFGVEVGMTIAAHRAGMRLIEVEAPFRHRVTGGDFKSKLHRLRQYLAVKAALKRALKER